MAARFRKVGVTTLGACAGLGLAGWALNPFDRQYAVSCIVLNTNGIGIVFESVAFHSLTTVFSFNRENLIFPLFKRFSSVWNRKIQ